MVTHTWVDLRIPEARLLADLHGIASDLQRAQEFGRLLLEQLRSPSPQWHLLEPLSIALAVAYARAFSGGVRHYLSEADLSTLTDEQREIHSFIKAYRDKHIAHSVNEFEENVARANYCLERVQDEGITAIGYGGGRLASLSGIQAEQVVSLAVTLEGQVRSQIESEAARLLIIVRRIPVADVLAGGQRAFKPNMANVGKRRK